MIKKILKVLSDHSLKKIKSFVTFAREPFFQIVKDYVTPDSIILDIGSGNGGFARYLKRNDVYMIDGNNATVDLLKKEFHNVYYGKLPELPFESNKFDIIHTSHLVEHLLPQELYDLLKEVDRCLKNDGVFVISAPMLNSRFYNDLSHVKPYYPEVFIRYLCPDNTSQFTRPIISDKYRIINEQYRYRYIDPRDTLDYFIGNNIVNILYYVLQWGMWVIGFRKLEKTGFTIVLKKESQNVLT